MKTIQEMEKEFEQIISNVVKIDGVSVELATQVGAVILQEYGKNYRTEMIRESKLNANGKYSNGNGGQPATEKQKNALDKFGIEYSSNITKAEASRLLDEAIAKANGKGKGRKSAYPFSF